VKEEWDKGGKAEEKKMDLLSKQGLLSTGKGKVGQEAESRGNLVQMSKAAGDGSMRAGVSVPPTGSSTIPGGTARSR